MLSNTITIVPSMDARVVEPLQAFSPSRVSLPTSLPLDTLAFARKTAAHEALVERIAEIIASYRISGPDDRYEDVYKPKLLETLRVFVTRQEPINLVVPAYPFKSPNREEKVLGPDVDVGERMSLEHFNSIGARIQQIYPPGGHVTIVSDGCCYNDLLGVSDEEVFRYAEGLHRITEKLQLRHLRFSDPFELIEGPEHVPTTEAEYAQRIGAVKDLLFNSYLPSGYDFDADLKKDPNALLTYRGYIKFLISDLATFFKERKMSKSAVKKHCSAVARGMIERGKAFAALVGIASPLHVRLSIHASDNTRKLSVALLPHKRYSNFPVTPWHTTPYLDADNASLTLSRKPAAGDGTETTYTLCHDELGLAFLRADVPMYRVIDAAHIQLEPLYPFGLRIRVPRDTPISRFRLANVAELARVHSPIVFEGLDPLQYTSEIADDFQRVAGGALSLSLLHEGIVPAGEAASYFVQVGGGGAEDGGAVMPFVEAAAALDDVRYRVLHQWRDGHAVVADHRVALPVHLSPSSLRVLRAGI
ncbi:isocyanide synthase family protein [Aspergillus clavatus NRRL 1]|uniref:Spore wall assembly protein Dit1, putative n=1 Tax=Aspergillus clavatus (strain ATCC 1007 / CBS 513.65 / DSM 816 / NCTC 3887 / NRRL 1 / QM 1276 / 107) TaxID=344612 RepID=A1CCF6_ASPCL|nr:spore wall assembly protein Dit1, putative [Aspergillus clavatus NRRL 1]EAW12213.1 spore wall assembly protein Dit1, putative [Aspergillus clavatus NRRL 1]